MGVNGSCGSAALKVMVEAGETVTLDSFSVILARPQRSPQCYLVPVLRALFVPGVPERSDRVWPPLGRKVERPGPPRGCRCQGCERSERDDKIQADLAASAA
jgi:hypothetical protein